MTTPLIAYLHEIGTTRATGANTPETSFYPAVKALLDAVGKDLEPKVRCIMNLRNQGAGLPDGGLFTVDQFGRRATGDDIDTALGKMKPSRGAIEVKPPSRNLGDLTKSKQASEYGTAYRHMLLTNLREFALVEYGESGPTCIERFELAEDESSFWRLCAAPSKAKAREDLFLDFLRRILKTPAPLTEPEDLAWFLASYARDALAEIEHAPVPGLTDIAANLETALGVAFGFGTDSDGALESDASKAKAQHFFRSVLIQTLFYGAFSAWVLWCQDAHGPTDKFTWRETSGRLQLPVLSALFHEMTRPTQLFSRLLLQRLLLAEATLNRVDRAAFFRRFAQHEAVQYFYEPFLEAFDPELRKELGVWYTPDEVVRYMVERVDQTLRNELGIKAGLADPDVLVLDPCCGTGAFVVGVLDRIHKTLLEQGDESLAPMAIVEAATSRIFGFEILPAPFVIAHLQVSLYLESKGVHLPENSRASIYLTNALTGWQAPQGKQIRLWEGLREERDQADQVKRKAKVLVVLGNPPYNAFAGVQPEDEGDSVEVFKKGLVNQWKIRKFNLDDLYIRFLRLAERRIVEQSKKGVICYVSNASYVSDKSFVVLRDRFLSEFDTITIDNCNGDSRETGKLTPDGNPDPSIFSTPRNKEGIRVGTAIGLFVLRGKKRKLGVRAKVSWRDFWGARKRKDLLASLEGSEPGYTAIETTKQQFWSFKPQSSTLGYATWPRIVDLCEHAPISGLAEMRRGGLLSLDREILVRRMSAYFDPTQSWDELLTEIGGIGQDAGRYGAKAARIRLLEDGDAFDAERIRKYALLPFDLRWCYHTASRPLWNEPRPTLVEQFWKGNRAIVVRTAARRPDEGKPAYSVSALPDYHLLDPNVVAIPMRWRSKLLNKVITQANLNAAARSYLERLGVTDPDVNEKSASMIWHHALAISYAPEWLSENGDAVRADFPRIPMPAKRNMLEKSAALGAKVANLLDPDVAVDGVTSGKLREDLRKLGILRRRDSIALGTNDLAIEARWGALQRGSVVMPGPGKVTAANGPELSAAPLGATFLDIWLNQEVSLHAVPEPVWNFTVGGYQVIKKWLSYRENAILGRALTLDEARHLTGMVRRIAALLMMSDELDANYREARNTHAWSVEGPGLE